MGRINEILYIDPEAPASRLEMRTAQFIGPFIRPLINLASTAPNEVEDVTDNDTNEAHADTTIHNPVHRELGQHAFFGISPGTGLAATNRPRKN